MAEGAPLPPPLGNERSRASRAAALAADRPKRSGAAAALISTGILVSRLFGLVRQSLIAKYLGTGAAADAFNASFKIPNILQNLFGEGALSASFIPVYSKVLAEGDAEEAGRVAGAVAALLGLVVAACVLVGVLLAPVLIQLIAPGFHGDKRQLTIQLTRIFFPGAGIFVISAWCLGVLNSHRRFLLSYSAPVLWNIAMIAALLGFGSRRNPTGMAITLAWASVVGAALQFLIQLPTAIALARPIKLWLGRGSDNVRRVMKNFGPAFVGRGVVQLSGYIDLWLASWLPEGTVALLTYAQTVYVLPVSLFGMAVSAAELPEMSRALGDTDQVAAYLRERLATGLRNIAFFVVPSAAAFLAFGDVIARLLFQHGRFSSQASLYAWGVLAGSAVGLLASTLGRLYSSTYYALHDTKTPLRFATVRVGLTTALGYLFAFWGPRLLGIDGHWGAAGLTSSAGIAGWVEFLLLRSRMNQRIGVTGLPASYTARLWACAAVGAALGWGVRILFTGHRGFISGALVLGVFGLTYLAATLVIGIPEARTALNKVTRRAGRR